MTKAIFLVSSFISEHIIRSCFELLAELSADSKVCVRQTEPRSIFYKTSFMVEIDDRFLVQLEVQ